MSNPSTIKYYIESSSLLFVERREKNRLFLSNGLRFYFNFLRNVTVLTYFVTFPIFLLKNYFSFYIQTPVPPSPFPPALTPTFPSSMDSSEGIRPFLGSQQDLGDQPEEWPRPSPHISRLTAGEPARDWTSPCECGSKLCEFICWWGTKPWQSGFVWLFGAHSLW